MSEISRRNFVLIATSGVLVGTVGCGTILHPERRGQPAGALDWKIVALDAVGLLLFFIPGVIAFAVDFSNGTIYLPAEQAGNQGDRHGGQLMPIAVEDRPITMHKVQQVVRQHSGRNIDLVPGSFYTAELGTIDEFWAVADKYQDVTTAPAS